MEESDYDYTSLYFLITLQVSLFVAAFMTGPYTYNYDDDENEVIIF